MKLLSTIIFLTSIHLQVNSQDLCIQLLTEDSVIALEENFEFLWLGTANEGVVRYNKFTSDVVHYDTANSSLNSNHIRSIFRYGGQIILSTDLGLHQYGGFSFVSLNDTLSGQLGIGTDGRLALAGDHTYFEILNGEVVYEKDLMELVSFSCDFCEHSTDIATDIDGNIWISHYGFYEFDLLNYNGDAWVLHDWQTTAGSLPVESWNPLNHIDVHNGLVQASTGNLYQYEGNSWTGIESAIISVEGDTLELPITEIAQDQAQGTWYGTTHNFWDNTPGKLLYHDNVAWHFVEFPTDDPLDIHWINPSITDSDLIYVGTSHGLYEVNKSCLNLPIGISESSKMDLHLFPNPTSGKINVQGIETTTPIVIYNAMGKAVLTIDLLPKACIDLSAFPAGIYLLSTANQTLRIIKRD